MKPICGLKEGIRGGRRPHSGLTGVEKKNNSPRKKKKLVGCGALGTVPWNSRNGVWSRPRSGSFTYSTRGIATSCMDRLLGGSVATGYSPISWGTRPNGRVALSLGC